MFLTDDKSLRSSSNRRLTSAALVLLLFICSPLAVAEDKGGIDTLRQTSKAFTEIAEKAKPAVVGIKAEKTVTWSYPTMPDWPFGDLFGPFEDDLFERFFRRQMPRRRSPQQKSRQYAQGSGFIISTDGHIITNNHLAQDADKITVILADGREFEAETVGTDRDTDIAVLKVDASKLTALEMADSDSLEVGEWVLAIGNPFGLSQTVTAGIVSAKGRSGFRLTEYEDYIQTDAAINPGNSGGPLLNLDGEVVGINTFIISGSGGFMGIGFAIPINIAKTVYRQLVDTGKVVRGFLGVIIQDLTPELADSFDLKDSKGVLISEVTEDSAAEKAGLKQGDIIIEFDGQSVEKANVLQSRIAMLRPDSRAKVVILRDGKRKTLTVKLGERPKEAITAGRSEALEQLGFAVKNLTDDLAQRLGYEGLTGVVVVQVESGSQAEQKGITAGMLILEVDRKPVKNTKDFEEAIEKAGKEGSILLLVTDGRHTRFVVLRLPKE